MNKFKKMLSVALAGCMAVATDMSDIEVSEESSISPRISFSCDLTGLAAGKEKVGWTKLSLDEGDKITFTGDWKPDNAGLIITIYRLNSNNQYVWNNSYATLKRYESWTANIRSSGIYQITVKPTYMISGGSVIADFK